MLCQYHCRGDPAAIPEQGALSILAERREVAGSVAAYLGASDGEDFGAVHRAHDLPAPGRNTGAQKEPVEIDALIAQRIALVDADDRWRKPLNVLLSCEGWPGQRVVPGEGLDPVPDGAAVVMQVEQDPVVFRRGGALRRRPLTGDVRAQRVQARDKAELTVLLEFETGSERQVAAAALARDDDAGSVDVEVPGVGGDPLQPRQAVVETGWERGHLGYGRGHHRVAEVDHHHCNAVGRDDLAPAAVHAVVAGQRRHAATVDVIDTGDRLVTVGPDDLNVDRVAIRLRYDLLAVHPQPGGGSGVLGVAQFHERAEQRRLLSRSLRVRFGQQRLATVDVTCGLHRDAGQDRFESGVQPDVSGNVVRHDAVLLGPLVVPTSHHLLWTVDASRFEVMRPVPNRTRSATRQQQPATSGACKQVR